MFTGLLNKNATIYAASIAPDAYGGQSVVLSIVASSVPCRIRPLNATERIMLGREGLDAAYRIYFDGNISILQTYVITVDALTGLEVVRITNPSLMNHHLEVDVQSKDAGATT